MRNNIDSVVTRQSKIFAILTWVGTLFFGFIPALIFYLVKKDDPYIRYHAKEAFNWSITAIIGFFAGHILACILIGIAVFFVVGIAHLVFCIMGITAASHGKKFRVPFSIYSPY